MSTTLIALILLVSLTGIITSLIYIHNKHHKKEKGKLLQQFSMLGTSYNLSFSSQEVFSHGIIGLDGIRRKLLYLGAKDQWHQLIDLESVKSCTVKKNYMNQPDTTTKSKVDVQVQDITLSFSFKNEKDPVHILFYSLALHNIYLRAELEAKAQEWQTMLSKILTSVQARRA